MSGFMKYLNIIVSVVLVVLIVFMVIKADNKLSDSISEQEKEIQTLNQKLGQNVRDYSNIQSQIDSNQMQLIDVWLGSLSDTAYAKLETWEQNNQEFISCPKEFRNVLIKRSHYTYEESPAKVLVYFFKTGDLIYEKSGEVYCYKEPSDMNPPKVDCKELCEVQNEETE